MYELGGGSYGFTAYVTAFHVRVVARTLRSRYGFAETTRTMRAIHGAQRRYAYGVDSSRFVTNWNSLGEFEQQCTYEANGSR